MEIKKIALKKNLTIEIIVSDSSKDGSDEIAKRKGALLIKHDMEGYGFAIREGVRHAKGEIVIYADADNTYHFADIPKFLEKLEEADIVIGSRFSGRIEKGAMPLSHRFLGTPLFNILLRFIFGIKISDSQSGYRAMRKKTFSELNLKTDGMEFATEMIIKAKKKNMKIKEIPIDYSKRKGVSKLRRYRDGMAHLKYILVQTPLAFYFTSGIFFFVVGITSLILANLPLQNLPALFNSATVKILFPILGIELIFLGFFAKTILYTKYKEENEFIRSFYLTIKFRTAIFISSLLILIPIIFKLAGHTDQLFEIFLMSTILGIQIIFNLLILLIFNPFTLYKDKSNIIEV